MKLQYVMAVGGWSVADANGFVIKFFNSREKALEFLHQHEKRMV